MAKLGYYNKTTSKAYIGSTAVKKIYYGSTLLYSSKPQLATPTVTWNSANSYFQWSSISMAGKYEIYWDGVYDTYTNYKFWIPSHYADSPTSQYIGPHTVQVKAIPSSSYSSTYDPSNLSTALTYTVYYRMRTPSVSLSGTVINVYLLDQYITTECKIRLYFNGVLANSYDYDSSWNGMGAYIDIASIAPSNGTQITAVVTADGLNQYCLDSYESSSVTYTGGGGGGGESGEYHVSLSYSVWNHGQNDIGPGDIAVYNENWDYLGSFSWGDNEIIIVAPTSTIYIEGPNQYDSSIEVTINVWGGTGGDLYESGPGDGPVALAYTISDGESLSVDYYYDYY